MGAADAVWRAWPDEVLVRAFGSDTVSRGRDYAAQGRVGPCEIGAAPDRAIATATVRGSGRQSYRTLVTCGVDGSLTTRCTCPIGSRCKHAVAVIYAAREQAAAEPVPAWQRALRALADDAATPAAATPLALEFSGWPMLRLRPLSRGRSGRWVRSDVTWETLTADYHSQFVPGQRRALLEVRRASGLTGYFGGYVSRGADLGLHDADAAVWPALRAAAGAGVTFVSAPGTPPVRVAEEPGSLVVEVDRTPTGVSLEGRFRMPGVPRGAEARLIGNPAHGVGALQGDELVLAGFERPLTSAQQALVNRTEPLHVPDADLPRFAAGYLPTLRRTMEVRVDPAVVLPEVHPPVLTLTVTPEAGHSASLRWAVAYRVGDDEGRIEVPPHPGPDDAVARDDDAETALFGALPPGPWREHEAAGRRRPHAVSTLGGRDLIAFVGETLPVLRSLPGVEVSVEGELPDYRQADDAPEVRLAVTEHAGGDPDWFGLGVEVLIEGEQVPFADLFIALARGEDHLVLDSGVWFDLDHPELQSLRQLIEEASELGDGEPGDLRLRLEHASLWQELVALGVVAEQAERWRRSVEALLVPERLPAVPDPATLRATLRPYQRAGVAWLHFLWGNGLGGILADDMGLGKTLQTLAAVAAMRESGRLDHPVLVVAPSSVLATWADEARRFTPDLDVRLVPQTAAKRGTSLDAVVEGADVVVTSYTLLRLDADAWASRTWAAVFLDEAQFVKNRQSRVYQAVRRLRATARFAITGTPLENNLMDLWSLVSITSPGLFSDPGVFTEQYRRPIENRTDPDALPRLRRRLRPILLRRTKESVAADLPPKQEQVLAVELSAAHRRAYDRQLAAERRKVLGLVDDLSHHRIEVLRSLTLLRRLALSPRLVDAAAPAASAKIDLLVELLGEISAEGHRALVFSQFTSFLALVRDRLDADGIGHQYLDGRTRDRAARVRAFREGDDPAFLISLKAGGFGLTLTEADYVFVLDPWWNPAAELQAIDRTHRIGQDKHVMVYRLVSADTIEEKVVALQERKRDLFGSVVGADADLAAPLRADDIRALLEP